MIKTETFMRLSAARPQTSEQTLIMLPVVIN